MKLDRRMADCPSAWVGFVHWCQKDLVWTGIESLLQEVDTLEDQLFLFNQGLSYYDASMSTVESGVVIFQDPKKYSLFVLTFSGYHANKN